MICGDCQNWKRIICRKKKDKGFCSVSNQEAYDRLTAKIEERKVIQRMLEGKELIDYEYETGLMESARQSCRNITCIDSECTLLNC